jgi:hypothetical protein
MEHDDHAMKPNEEQLADLARMLDCTEEVEIDCDELLARVAAYLESVSGGAVLTETLRQVGRHLALCPECYEEFVALVKAEGLDPDKVLEHKDG